MELLIGDLSLQVNPPSLLGMIHSTEAGDIDHTLLVDIHVTGCGERRRRVRVAICSVITASVLCCRSRSENELSPNLILCYHVFGDIKNC